MSGSDGPVTSFIIEIPPALVKRLGDLGPRFVKVFMKDKNPIEKAWQKRDNLMASDNLERECYEMNGKREAVNPKEAQGRSLGGRSKPRANRRHESNHKKGG